VTRLFSSLQFPKGDHSPLNEFTDNMLHPRISKALVTINNYNFQDKVSLEKEQWVYLKKTTASVYSGIKSQAILDGVIFCLSLVLFLKLHKSEV
jgi:hypothetical protein